MKAFHNEKKIKDKYIARVKAHQLADEIIQGQYWEQGYEDELGIPRWIARVQDKLFEGMSNEDAKLFPLKFLQAIPLGVDLEKAKAPFFIFLLETVLTDFDNKKFPKQAKAINNVIVLYRENCTDVNEWRNARAAAADAAAYAAAYADAADAAAYAAAYAASAASAAYADAADADARRKRYKLFADKLLEIFKTLEKS